MIEPYTLGQTPHDFRAKLNEVIAALNPVIGGGASVSWGTVTDKPQYIAAGGSAQAARQAIGAGTSNLILADPGGTNGSATTAARSDHSHAPATHENAGFMSASDKEKLDGVAVGANAYTDADAVAAVAGKGQIAGLTPIADPSTADAQACATAINQIIAALQA